MATFPMLRDRVDRFKLRSYMLLDLVEAQVTSEMLLRRVAEIRREIAAIMDWPPPASVWTNVAILTMSDRLSSLIEESSAAGSRAIVPNHSPAPIRPAGL